MNELANLAEGTQEGSQVGSTPAPLDQLFGVVPLLNDEGTGPDPDFNYFVHLSEFFPLLLAEEYRDLQALQAEAEQIPGFDRVLWQEAESILVQSDLPADAVKAAFITMLAPKITGDWQSLIYPQSDS
ncbi:MAG TPA: hypothetical protein VJR05_00885 [Acidimicrobiia bacterium]|nr:hypothetical protein [Acidimicrobiia bacterium]